MPKKKSPKSTRAASVRGTPTATGRGSKAGTKSKAQGKSGRKTQPPARVTKSKVKPGQQVGAPPVDMAPPDIKDSRPVHQPSPHKVAGADSPNPQTTSTDAANSSPATGTAPAATPATATAPARATELYGPMVQGANCTWIGRMSQTVEDEKGVPKCPNCGGPLVEAVDEETMRLGFEQYELGAYTSINPPPRPHPGYVGFALWMKGSGKCWFSIESAADAYFAATGTRVDPSR